MEETEVQVEQEVAAPEITQNETEPEKIDGKHPLEIARRIELGKRKAAEKRAEEAERRAIAAEERAKILAEKPKTEEKVYTPEEVQALIDGGQLKPAIGYAYIARVEAERVQKERERKQQEMAPVERATADLRSYVELVPSLADATSEEFQKASREYDDLVRQGWPDDNRTRVLAIRMAHGNLDSLKRKQETAALSRKAPTMPIDTAGNGGNGNKDSAQDISKAPATLVAKWDKMNIPEDRRKKQYAIYVQKVKEAGLKA